MSLHQCRNASRQTTATVSDHIKNTIEARGRMISAERERRHDTGRGSRDRFRAKLQWRTDSRSRGNVGRDNQMHALYGHDAREHAVSSRRRRQYVMQRDALVVLGGGEGFCQRGT